MRIAALAVLIFACVPTGSDSASSAKEADDSDDENTKKKKRKKKKGKSQRKNESSLTDEEITAACKRAVDEKLDALAGDRDRCEKDYREAWDKPNRVDDLDDVKVALGRYDCTMESSSPSSFSSCVRDVLKGAKQKRRKTDSCSYRDKKGKTHSVTLGAKDAEVTIYERKTGRRLANKTFRVDGQISCKSSVAKKDIHKETTKYLSHHGAEIATWAKAELAK